MELKPYQQQVLNDLTLFLEHIQESRDVKNAFQDFWAKHPRTPLQPFPGMAIEPYKNNVPRVPHICVKVPTAGGKTFIACNAIKNIFDAFDHDKPKAVVWLVPSVTILEQTLKNLKDPAHPYRQKINAHFGNRVEVFEKSTLLQGSGFNATTVKEQLNIMVFSFDSLRAKNKEDRKVFQENGNLQSFENLLGKEAEITLGAVIKHLNPLVIVDESHNAESELSVDMLKEINPCFILDLTATPRKNSNIISFIDALELKKENMVKLPVIVYNHHDKTAVINSALQLQKRLEAQAKQEQKNGGRYIRPIVLFQVQPKNGVSFLNEDEEKSNVQKLRDKLLEFKIPPEQIKIKTAYVNEIKGLDLMSKKCEVRYIITINALKEGWDCPFAYILASLADKSSAVDVEQILGRVLRQPYVMKHTAHTLNLCYVLTASSKFMETLDNIVKGLNKAGFSSKDYKTASFTPPLVEVKKQEAIQQTIEFPKAEEIPMDYDITADIDPTQLFEETVVDTSDDIENNHINTAGTAGNTTVMGTIFEIEKLAREKNDDFEKFVVETNAANSIILPNELQQLVKSYTIKEIFREQAEQICLPQFFLKVPKNDLFDVQGEVPLEASSLLEGFQLSKGDQNIAFDSINSQLYKVDLDETKNDHTPTFVRIDGAVKEEVMAYMLDSSKKDVRVKNFTRYIMEIIGKMYPIPDKEVERYIRLILETFNDEQFNDFLNNRYSYTDKIKEKIRSLSEIYAEEQFESWLEEGKIFIKPVFQLPKQIAPGDTAKDIAKSLYEKEGKMNGFEERVINEIGNMPNIVFWTRNIERKGFRINGFINHYPDFIIQTKSGITIVLETKGDHLDAKQKIELGRHWKNHAGINYRYYMVYDRREVDGAYKLDDFLKLIRNI